MHSLPTPRHAEAWRTANARPAIRHGHYANHPRPLPPRQRPADSRAYRLAIYGLRAVVIVAMLLALAATFFLFGEERERQPLRPAQPAQPPVHSQSAWYYE